MRADAPAQPHASSASPTTREIARVIARIKPILAGRPAEMQGAILADLLAIWLAGHEVQGDEEATRMMRAELLADHCGAVRQLTSINAGIMGTTP
jgi:hypothetical protein